MPTMVDDQDAVGASQGLENRPPIEQSCRTQAMQKQQGRRVRGSSGLPHENFAAPEKCDLSLSPARFIVLLTNFERARPGAVV
jgi:hypothetical protein